jgi:hypothetical protein
MVFPRGTSALDIDILRWRAAEKRALFDAPHVLARLHRLSQRPRRRRAGNSSNEIASSHCQPQAREYARTFNSGHQSKKLWLAK